MSANPGDRPRDDSFEDKGSPAQDAKDGDLSTALEFSSIVALICGVIAAVATPWLASSVPQVDPLGIDSDDAEVGESKSDVMPKVF